jgi:hypothetical protein
MKNSHFTALMTFMMNAPEARKSEWLFSVCRCLEIESRHMDKTIHACNEEVIGTRFSQARKEQDAGRSDGSVERLVNRCCLNKGCDVITPFCR